MFNPLEPYEVVLAVGRVLRRAADADAPDDGYGRGQLLAAYSVARHLAAEQRGGAALLADAKAGLERILAGASAPAAAEARAGVSSATRSAELGTALARLLPTLGEDEEGRALRRRLRRLLADLTDREVAALAQAER